MKLAQRITLISGILVCMISAYAAEKRTGSVHASISFNDITTGKVTLHIVNEAEQEIKFIKPERAQYTHELKWLVKTSDGRLLPEQQTMIVDFARPRPGDYTVVPAHATKALEIPVAPFHHLEAGKLYFLTLTYVSTTPGQELNLTFPYGVPQDETAGLWSKESNGLQGRLRVDDSEIKKTRSLAVYAEFRSISIEPLSFDVPFIANIELLVFDADGKAIMETWHQHYNEYGPDRQVVEVNRDANIGFRIDEPSFDIPKDGTVQLVVKDKVWLLKPGTYTLKGSFTSAAILKTRIQLSTIGLWNGQIEFPPVKFTIQP